MARILVEAGARIHLALARETLEDHFTRLTAGTRADLAPASTPTQPAHTLTRPDWIYELATASAST